MKAVSKKRFSCGTTLSRMLTAFTPRFRNRPATAPNDGPKKLIQYFISTTSGLSAAMRSAAGPQVKGPTLLRIRGALIGSA